MYTAQCVHCDCAIQAIDAFEIIRVQKWKLNIHYNSKGKAIKNIWHCPKCKGVCQNIKAHL